MGECLITLSVSLLNTDDKKGKAVAILHYYGDLLAHTVTPNSGFGSSVIYPATSPTDSSISAEPEPATISSSVDSPPAAAVVECVDDICADNYENVRS